VGELQRSLGLGSLTFYGVGLILGAGIYSILGEAAGIAGAALWMSFLLGSLAALLTGLSYAELATMFPRAGAEYVYVREAWPRMSWLPGTLGWVLVVAGLATTATVALAFAGYATLFISFPPWIVAATLVVAATTLNVVGINEASWANIVFTLIEAAGLVALIVVGARDPDFADVVAAAPQAGVLSAAGLIFFAYLGFEDIANLAEEAKHPARDIPRAIVIAVTVSTVLYVLVAVSSVALLDPARLAASASPLAEAMREGAPRLAGALGGVALFATANTALITIMAASRLLFSMARGGDAPSLLTRTLALRKTPAGAIAVAGLGALLFLPLGGIGIVGSVASLTALLAFASVKATVIRLRQSRPEAERPFRVPLAPGRVPLLTALGLLIVVVLLTQFEVRAYGIAVAALILAFIAQAAPWERVGVGSRARTRRSRFPTGGSGSERT
jgi:amino acid transporter